MASARGFLERAGLRSRVLDLAVDRFDPSEARGVPLVALSVPMHTALRMGVTAAAAVRRESPGAHIVLFGHYALLNAEYLLREVCDSIIAGEPEEALVALARRIASPGRPGASLRGVPGVVFPGDPARPVLERVAFGLPDRRGLPPPGRYAHLERAGGTRVHTGSVESSRGCLHRCRHCPIPPVYGGRFFVVPPDVVLADIGQQIGAGARHITFADPDFLNGPGHAREVVRRLHETHPGVTFDFTAKVEHLLRHRRLLPELAAGGCAFVVSAVESLSDEVLRILDKGHTRGDVEEVLGVTREAGIPLRPTWVPFTPWTSRTDYDEILDFIESEDLVDHVDPVQLTVRLLVPPGSLLVDTPEMRAHLGPLDEPGLVHPWRHPDRDMDRLQREAAALVEAASSAEEAPATTFRRVRALARGEDPASVPAETAPRAGTVPRITEPWFC